MTAAFAISQLRRDDNDRPYWALMAHTTGDRRRGAQAVLHEWLLEREPAPGTYRIDGHHGWSAQLPWTGERVAL